MIRLAGEWVERPDVPDVFRDDPPWNREPLQDPTRKGRNGGEKKKENMV